MAPKIRTPEEAVAWLQAEERSNTYEFDGQCKQLARTAYNIPSDGSPSALSAWLRTDHRGVGDPPLGAFVFWPNKPNGHVGVCDGKGNIIANVDWAPANGRVRTMSIKAISAALHCQPSGWSRDIEGVLAVHEKVSLSAPDFKVVNLGAVPNADGVYPGVVGDLLGLCGWGRDAAGAKSLQRHLGRPTTGRLGKVELAWLAARFSLATK